MRNSSNVFGAEIQADGSFFVPTNLAPGKYKATAEVTLPESDDSLRSDGYHGPDCIATAEFTVPDPARGPFGSPPVELEIKMEVAENVRFLRSNAPADPPQAVQPPAGKAEEPFTAWGKEVGGLQAGLGFKAGEKRAYTHGDWATLVVRVRNVGKEEVKFQYLRQFFVEQPPTVFNEKGELKQLGRTTAFGIHSPVEVKLAAGKEIELYELKLYLGTGSEEGIPKYPYIFGTGKFQVQYEKVLGNSSSGSIKLDPTLSKLATGKLELEIKPVAPVQQEAPKPKSGSILKPAIEQKLKWGEPVNGLRAALVMHPVPDEPDAEDKNDIFLVVQNVTKAEVWLHASDAAPNPRQLIWRDKGALETINEIAKPIPTDFRLQPGEVAFFRMTHPPRKKNPGGRSEGSLIEESIRKDPTFSLEGSMEISTAPDGAWSGKLVSGRTEGGTAIPAVPQGETQEPLKPGAATPASPAASAPAIEAPKTEKPKGAAAKLPDSAYIKSGVPIGEFNAGEVTWSGEQNGLALAMSLEENVEWRVGGAVKVELWVCNAGEKELKIQHFARPDVGLRVLMKGADGKEHEAAIAQSRYRVFAHPVLLPAGHVFKAQEFSVLFLPPGGGCAGRGAALHARSGCLQIPLRTDDGWCRWKTEYSCRRRVDGHAQERRGGCEARGDRCAEDRRHEGGGTEAGHYARFPRAGCDAEADASFQ